MSVQPANQSSPSATRSTAGRGPKETISRAALVLALVLLAATFFLISPPPGKTYPGAKPWSDLSVLRSVTELMSLGGALATVRGAEIKDFALHLTAAAGLLLVGLRVLARCRGAGRRPDLRSEAPATDSRAPFAGLTLAERAAGYAQVLLAGWVLLALLSGLWSGEPSFSAGQAALYALNLGWAIALAATLDRRDVPRLLYGLLVISALGAGLCVWYYYERNRYHRPGFPLGNPNVLATAILPAILIGGAVLGGAARDVWRTRRLVFIWPIVGAAVALVPLVWCQVLTQARGALLALVVGVAAVAVLLAGRRLRWIMAGTCVAGLLLAGTWWFYSSRLDVAMARGATVRFRLYAWRYATEFWREGPMLGSGAGAYPRLAGKLEVYDKALDPAAFMGEIVEHAHNELFEVLAEIGLVGGVTWVAGFLATFVAAAALLRATKTAPSRWLLLALVGGVAAFLADAMVGVTLRLPGGAGIFSTILGTLWAACRGGSENARLHDESPDAPVPPAAAQSARSNARPRLRSSSTALVCFAAALGAGSLAVWNWTGVVLEQSATAAFEHGQFTDARTQILAAEPRLLDPVRKVAARKLALGSRAALARAAVLAWLYTPTSQPSEDARQSAIGLSRATFFEALWLGRDVPALAYSDATAARAAGDLYELERKSQPQDAVQWLREARLAWVWQRWRTPFDVETLLALNRYSVSPDDHIGVLRDALRSLDTLSFDPEPRFLQQLWQQALADAAAGPGFEEALAAFVAAAGPITPETDLDSLIASMAPETHRLAAAWHALNRDYAAAAKEAAEAAELYRPMRPRFPELYSRALAEQAGYVLRGSADGAPRAIELLRQAIAALPVIQLQQFDQMARPFRCRVGLYLLVAGRTEEGVQALRAGLADLVGQREVLVNTVQALLQEAAASGVPPADVERIGHTLEQTLLVPQPSPGEGE